jgi:hypothetical protein
MKLIDYKPSPLEKDKRVKIKFALFPRRMYTVKYGITGKTLRYNSSGNRNYISMIWLERYMVTDIFDGKRWERESVRQYSKSVMDTLIS